MLEIFGYMSGALMMLSVVPYIRSILKENTKPQNSLFDLEYFDFDCLFLSIS